MRETLLGRRGRWALLALGMLFGVLVVLLVAAVVTAAVNSSETNERGQERESQVAANDEALAIIKDCTETDGECYQRGQKRTARILASAQRIIIISAACAVDLDESLPVQDRVQLITDCVTDRLTAS